MDDEYFLDNENIGGNNGSNNKTMGNVSQLNQSYGSNIKFAKKSSNLLYIDNKGYKHIIRPHTPRTQEACFQLGITPDIF